MEITDIKCGLLSKHLFQRTQQHGGCYKIYVTISLYKTQCFQAITWNKKHSSKKVLSMVHILEKDFFAAVNCKSL